ncbi:MAG: glycerol-3-phosphate acyltransferase [Anaerolineae bacterium]
MIANFILIGLTSYLLGSIPFGVIMGKLWGGVDIRAGGSGHSGALNTWRMVGLAPAIIAALGDIAKALVAVKVAQVYGINEWAIVVAVPLVIAGHCWPVFLRFQGGMGLATACISLFYLSPLIMVIMLAVWGGWALVLRHAPRATGASALTLPVIIWLLGEPSYMLVLGVIAGGLIFVRHVPDFGRVYRRFWLD